MGKEYSKVVLLPLRVASGNFCWDKDRICGHFRNEGGHSRCAVKYWWNLKADKEGRILKPVECKNLKEVNKDA